MSLRHSLSPTHKGSQIPGAQDLEYKIKVVGKKNYASDREKRLAFFFYFKTSRDHSSNQDLVGFLNLFLSPHVKRLRIDIKLD